MTTPKGAKSILTNSSLALTSIVIAFLIAEFVIRDYSRGFTNFILSQNGGNLVEDQFKGLYQYDPLTGWIPRPGAVAGKWDVKIHILEDGIRSNGRPFNGDPRPLFLAIGDSFTFGNEVADHQTWPAVLEAISHQRVLNAGVSSYGLDQSVLRAENLIEKYHPDTVIISLIHDDIIRLGQTVRHGVPKPYFTLENSALRLHHNPVPFQSMVRFDLFRSIFGYSHLAHKLMDSYFPRYWRRNTMHDVRTIDSFPIAVARLLIDRIQGVAERNRISLIFIIQGALGDSYDTLLSMIPLVEHIKKSHLPVVEILPRLLLLKQNVPEKYRGFFIKGFHRHMSPTGNAWVARQIEKRL